MLKVTTASEIHVYEINSIINYVNNNKQIEELQINFD